MPNIEQGQEPLRVNKVEKTQTLQERVAFFNNLAENSQSSASRGSQEIDRLNEDAAESDEKKLAAVRESLFGEAPTPEEGSEDSDSAPEETEEIEQEVNNTRVNTTENRMSPEDQEAMRKAAEVFQRLNIDVANEGNEELVKKLLTKKNGKRPVEEIYDVAESGKAELNNDGSITGLDLETAKTLTELIDDKEVGNTSELYEVFISGNGEENLVENSDEIKSRENTEDMRFKIMFKTS